MILVGGLEHDFHFFLYWECHFIPTDELIFFQRGGYTANQYRLIYPLVN